MKNFFIPWTLRPLYFLTFVSLILLGSGAQANYHNELLPDESEQTLEQEAASELVSSPELLAMLREIADTFEEGYIETSDGEIVSAGELFEMFHMARNENYEPIQVASSTKILIAAGAKLANANKKIKIPTTDAKKFATKINRGFFGKLVGPNKGCYSIGDKSTGNRMLSNRDKEIIWAGDHKLYEKMISKLC